MVLVRVVKFKLIEVVLSVHGTLAVMACISQCLSHLSVVVPKLTRSEIFALAVCCAKAAAARTTAKEILVSIMLVSGS